MIRNRLHVFNLANCGGAIEFSAPGPSSEDATFAGPSERATHFFALEPFFSCEVVSRGAPQDGAFCLVFQWKRAIFSNTKPSDVGTTPEWRLRKLIRSLGSTWQVGGKNYCALGMRAARASEQSTRFGQCARYITKIRDAGTERRKGLRANAVTNLWRKFPGPRWHRGRCT